MGIQPGLSESEREVLKVLWDHGPGTVREINEVLAHRGRRWAYTTVATLLQRLGAKQYVASDPSVVPHIYRAAVTRDEILERRLQDAADELCDGRAAPLVLALVQGGRFSAEELARLRRLMDEAAGGPPPPPPKSRPKPKPKT
jgi:BlaI family transcriptional regulator, penicillinase repressor